MVAWRLKWASIAIIVLAAFVQQQVQAAYTGTPPLTVGIVNPSGQFVGSDSFGDLVLPLRVMEMPPFTLFPSAPSAFGKGALFPDLMGRLSTEITDGIQIATIAPPFRGATTSQPALTVALSPNPSLQCPLSVAVNTTGNATVITNPGGKLIHVCLVVLINGATAQSVTLLEGTGTACATGPTYWLGGSGATAALAVNGGFSVPGNWINFPMQKAGDNVCVLISGSTNLSGAMTYGIWSP